MHRRLFGEEASVLRELDFRLLLLSTIIAPLGPTLLSPLLDSYTGVFDVSTTSIGLLLSVYTAPAIVFIPLLGRLADRYGRKPILVSSLLLFGLSGTAIAFTTDFRTALILRLLQGIGGAGITPTLITITGDLYADAREATAQGLRLSFTGLSQTVFPVLAGVLVAVVWWYPLLVFSLALPVGVIVYLFLTEPDVSDIKNSGPSAGARAAESGTNWTSLVELLSNRRILVMIGARALVGFAFYAFLTYNSFIVVHAVGRSSAEAGVLVAVYSVILAGSASQTGRLTEFWSSKTGLAILSNAVIGVGLVVLALASTFSTAVLASLLFGAGMGPLMSLYRSLITGLAPADRRARVVGLSEAFGKVGSTGAPVFLGALAAAAEASLGPVGAVRLAVFVGALIGAGGGAVLVFYFRRQ